MEETVTESRMSPFEKCAGICCSLGAACLIGFGTFKFFTSNPIEQPFAPFTDAIMEITWVQSASQAAMIFNPNLGKKTTYAPAVDTGYLYSDQGSGWTTIE